MKRLTAMELKELESENIKLPVEGSVLKLLTREENKAPVASYRGIERCG
ncbi:hypothetical protein LINGRAHAP2_LOCUS35793 [Linum grandiflorum]